MFVRAVLLAASLGCCSTQTFNLFPGLKAPTGRLFGGITIVPTVGQPTQVGNPLLAPSKNSVTPVPMLDVRSLRNSYGFPTLVSDKNSVELTNRCITQFTAGLTNEDINFPITALVSKYGYQIEKHVVETEDGYVLTMHRIPKNNASVVFLMHGLLGSSDDWVVAGPLTGLAYLLADAGFDVWMGNSRGNKHSRLHKTLNTAQFYFWDFSWHEIGYYDLPAMINYVLLATSSSKLRYIGHSQGTTCFFVMASERPEYNDKISLMIALSPVAFMRYVKSPMVRLMAPGTPILDTISKGLGLYEVLPENETTKFLRRLLCVGRTLTGILCTNSVFLIAGFSLEQMNITNLPVLNSHMPSGASTKQIIHYGQLIISGDFNRFNYGLMGNMVKYGVALPPRYALENVRAPVAMFYSDTDWLADPRDVLELSNKLPNVVDFYKVPAVHFSHVDFILGKDVKTLILSRILKLFQ